MKRTVLSALVGNTRAGGNFGGSIVDGPAIPECNGVTGGRTTIDDKIVTLVFGCTAVCGKGSGSDGSATPVDNGDKTAGIDTLDVAILGGSVM